MFLSQTVLVRSLNPFLLNENKEIIFKPFKKQINNYCFDLKIY